MNNLYHRNRENSISHCFSCKMSHDFQMDQTIFVSLRLNSLPEVEGEGRKSLSIVVIVVYSRKGIMIQLFFFLYWLKWRNKLRLQKSMRKNKYNTHSKNISTGNKAGFALFFFSPHSISVWLEEDYEVFIVLFHNQTLKSPATEEMWLNVIVVGLMLPINLHITAQKMA